MTLTLVTSDIKTACRLSRQFEACGEYERAAERLRFFWKGLGEQPDTDGLSTEDKAELLLRVGVLTGWLGSTRQIEGSQPLARDYLSEAERLFADIAKVFECRNATAVTYWREGDFQTAAIIASTAFNECEPLTYPRASLINTLAIVGIRQRQFQKTREFMKAHYEEVNGLDALLERSHFHNNLGFVYQRLAEEATEADEKQSLYDAALIEYEGARDLYSKVPNLLFQARAENNIAMTFIVKGSPEGARRYIESAIGIAKARGDHSLLGSFEETRAQMLLGQGALRDALVAINSSLSYLRDGDQLSLQAESQTTLGVILARMGKLPEADEAFRRATELAETAQIGTVAIRLAHLRELAELFKAEATNYEREAVQLALETSGGRPSHAAKLLGISHQNMINKIKRFDLETVRTPAQPRRKKSA